MLDIVGRVGEGHIVFLLALQHAAVAQQRIEPAQHLGVVPGVPKFDPSFVILAMVASVEAIFLSTFILITQNRMSAAADKRAELDLQISLLAEHEVTKLAALLSAIADRLGVETDVDAEVDELKQDVAPEAVLDEIEERRQ